MTKAMIVKLIISYSHFYGIDPNIALAVVKVESNFNSTTISIDGKDIGLFQLRSTFFPKYTIKQLLNPSVNIKLGVERLAYDKRTCVHKGRYTFLVCYNLGSNAALKVHHPELFPYVKKIKANLSMYKDLVKDRQGAYD